MLLCLFEDAAVRHLAPLVTTRHTADLRLGPRTLAAQHVAAFRPSALALHARPEIAGVAAEEHPEATVNALPEGAAVLFVNARWAVEPGALVDAIRAVARPGEDARAFVQDGSLLAAWHPRPPATLLHADALDLAAFEGVPQEAVDGARLLHRLPDLIDDVPGRITRDVALMQDHLPRSVTMGQGAVVVGEDVFCAPDATIQAGAVVSSENGPVVVGSGATIGHNAVVEGPCYVGPKAVVKAMARVDGSVVGYWSKVGGEVHESVVHSLSSKGHDGYLGNSYLGRWCNLGADTNTSNLKNDYGDVTVYDRVAADFLPSGRQFAGLFMGDHAKCSINTMFNTGSVVGVFANLYGAGFPPRHVPDFSWGGADGLVPYRLEKAVRVAEAVMSRRDQTLTDADRQALAAAFGAAHGMTA